jgi:hypothetical protein
MLVDWQGDMSAGQFSTKLTLSLGRKTVNLSGGLFILQSKLDFIVSGYDKSMDIVEHVNEAVQSQEIQLVWDTNCALVLCAVSNTELACKGYALQSQETSL